jgi:hypothetical protein
MSMSIRPVGPATVKEIAKNLGTKVARKDRLGRVKAALKKKGRLPIFSTPALDALQQYVGLEIKGTLEQ